jgi:hypothetical protein
MITKIGRVFKVHFVVQKFQETPGDTRHRLKVVINTKNLKDRYEADREVDLILMKGHYMLNQKVMVTGYYLRNMAQLDDAFPELSQERRQLIYCQRPEDGAPRYKRSGTGVVKVLETMLELNMFKEIEYYDQDMLRTCEFKNKLADFVDLEYDERLCTQFVSKTFVEHGWSRIYYADFETDPTVSPHRPYLCCVVSKRGDKTFVKKFRDSRTLAHQFLDYLEDGSLTYFHNLTYDSCFFMNSAENYQIKLLERTGKVIKLTLSQFAEGRRTRVLTFMDSYRIIPAPLRAFAQMFNLQVHKELMPYKIYTAENVEKGKIPFEEFVHQFDVENPEAGDEARTQLRVNAEGAGALVDGLIDILEYAEFYCVKDCLVLMYGLQKFSADLAVIYKDCNTIMPQLSNFVSISAVGYSFARSFGCFDGCFELAGKPQEFILRCVSGGRCMCAGNRKQMVEGRIQDFDAVSLYPSAMWSMEGIPRGRPKVITPETDIWRASAFFVEISIKKLVPHADYQFGQVFTKSENGSKMFGNTAVEHFYTDKRGLKDLTEFYDIEYEVLRGYYFDDGFNRKIKAFIKKLFDLRNEYKKSGNPLEKTIKLLLNSIYGKSILKSIPTEIKVV